MNQHTKNLILLHLYNFRYLTRKQIQNLLKHKQSAKVILWLKELTQAGYIRRIHNKKTITIPATYSLGVKSRKYLKNQPEFQDMNLELLNRIYWEPKLSPQFRQHCVFLADIFLSLKYSEPNLRFYTKTMLSGMAHMILPLPDAYFSVDDKPYFLDIIDELPARMILRRRIRQYFDYYDQNTWQDHNLKPFPAIIIILPDERSKKYLHKFIRRMLEENPDLNFYLPTWEQIKVSGLKLIRSVTK